jgi:proline dehydrogenase
MDLAPGSNAVRHLERIEWSPNARYPPALDAWPYTIPAVVQLIDDGGIEIPAGITFVVGENGTGKSTLVEAFAAAYPRHGVAPSSVAPAASGAALSFRSCLGLMALLDTLRREGSQVVLATHSPVLVSLPGATLLEVGDWGIRRVDSADDLELVQEWRVPRRAGAIPSPPPRRLIRLYPARMIGSAGRSTILLVTQSRWFRWAATHRAVGWRVASRFVAGETLDDAMGAALELDAAGVATMLDHLGENVASEEQAAAAADAYVEALRRIEGRPGLDCQISVKLTQLGLDRSEEACVAHLERVLAAADAADRLVMIDMESHEYVDRTLAIFRDVRSRHERVGVCLQSALRRTAADVLTIPLASTVRLVKGAYLEPDDVAFQRRREVDASWAALFTTLVSRGHTVHVATHDERLIDGAIRVAAERSIPRSHVEYQMLYGVRRDLQARLAADGRPVRVYVPYGSQWYPYLTRRLVERPANMWFFVSNLLRSAR